MASIFVRKSTDKQSVTYSVTQFFIIYASPAVMVGLIALQVTKRVNLNQLKVIETQRLFQQRIEGVTQKMKEESVQ